MNSPVNLTPPGSQSAAPNNKPLWAAVGALSVAVLAMGGTMIYTQRAPAPAPSVAALSAAPQTTPLPPLPPLSPAASNSAADDLIEKPAAVPAKPAPAPAPAKKVVKPVPRPAPAPSHAGISPAPGPAPARVVCAVCGVVESVTPVQRSAKPDGPGVGAVAGGVLGAVLGNQVGHGNGRAAATILGAVGGGFAGNAIEGQVRKVTVYQVGIRMEDGSRRTMEIAQAPNVGSRVTVEGQNLRLQ